MSRSSFSGLPVSPALESLLPELENAPSLHALLERGLALLSEALRTTPLLYLERRGTGSPGAPPLSGPGRYVLYAAHGVGLSEDYATMQPSAGQLERLRQGAVLMLSAPGVGGSLERLGCDGNACMVGVGLRSSERLLGWIWLYQRQPPSEALRRELSEFGARWGTALAQLRG